MSHPDVITTIWDDPRNVDTLVKLYTEGKSFAQIAAAIPGATRNACISKVHRMKLPPRADRYAQSRHTSSRARTINGEIPRKGNSGAPGQAKGNVILHRAEGRKRAEAKGLAFKIAQARKDGLGLEEGMEAVLGHKRVGPTHFHGDEGVDVTSLIGIMDLNAHTCRWPIGDPLEPDFGFCGKHTAENKPYCEDHCRRAFTATPGVSA